jgi:hypothetical protein
VCQAGAVRGQAAVGHRVRPGPPLRRRRVSEPGGTGRGRRAGLAA